MVASTLTAPVSVRARLFGAALLEPQGAACQCGYPRIDLRTAGLGAARCDARQCGKQTTVEAARLAVDTSPLQNLWKGGVVREL